MINKIKSIAICSFLILIILSLIILFNKNQTPNLQIDKLKEDKTNATKTIYESLPTKLSYSEYINDRNKYYNMNISLIGFLRYKLEGNENSGTYNEYITDDFNQEIKLTNIPQQYRNLFVIKQTSKELYNVSGIFRYKFKSIEVEVFNITLTERPSQIVAREVKNLKS